MASPKQNKTLAALNPVSIKETIKKVDQCLLRLQEIHYTLAGGTKVLSGVSLGPRNTKGYLRTSLRCKQESLRINNRAARLSPQGKFPKLANLEGEWKQMSLPAMLVDETVGEILQASQFARKLFSTVGSRRTTTKDPKTPTSQRPNLKVDLENTELEARRKKEKQIKLQSDSPPHHRARSRINFKVSPPKVTEFDTENKRVSPSDGPCTSKTVSSPHPLFLSTSSSQQQQFCKTRSPVISRNRGTQHKFLMKSPTSHSPSKFEVKVKSPLIVSVSSPSRATNLSKKRSPKRWARPFSPSRVATRLASPLKSKKIVQRSDGLNKSSPKILSGASKLRRSFSPSRLASRLVSPLKSKKSVQQSDGLVSGVKQRPAASIVQILDPRIKNIS